MNAYKKTHRLVATTPPSFSVSALTVNASATLVCLWGAKGALVLRLPRRSGFQTKQKSSHMCKSHMLDERHYMSNADIYQAVWHPGSSTQSHLLLLASDNTLRLYDALGGAGSSRVLPCGRQGARGSVLPPQALGGAAMALVVHPGDKRNSWTAALLRGNGDVYHLDVTIEYTGGPSPRVEGPLTMYPPADDNYGVESCSLLMLGSRLLCIATQGGVLYHCIMLPDEQDPDKSLNHSFALPSQSLYVIEAIELDLGLSLSDSDPSYTCPIYLKADEGVKNRYFCSHETGVHIITVPMVNKIEAFFNGSDDDIDGLLPSLTQPSIAEYSICTKTSKMSAVNPVVGLCLAYSPHVLITLLADGRLVVKSLQTDTLLDQLFTDYKDTKGAANRSSDLSSSLRELQKVPFNHHIQQILQHELSQPILKMAANSDATAHDCLELLTHATHVFREEFFTKHERVRKEIQSRVKTLRLLKGHQLHEVREWRSNSQLVDQEARRLKEKCQLVQEKQTQLNKRCEKAVRALRQKQSEPSAVEKEMSQELSEAAKKAEALKKEIEKVKQTQKYQQMKMKNWDLNDSKKEVCLGKNHSDIIKSTLEDHNEQIKEIIKEINAMKTELSMA